MKTIYSTSNSGRFDNASAIAFAASTPNVFPSRQRACMSLEVLIALQISSADNEHKMSKGFQNRDHVIPVNTLTVPKFISSLTYCFNIFDINKAEDLFLSPSKQ